MAIGIAALVAVEATVVEAIVVEAVDAGFAEELVLEVELELAVVEVASVTIIVLVAKTADEAEDTCSE